MYLHEVTISAGKLIGREKYIEYHLLGISGNPSSPPPWPLNVPNYAASGIPWIQPYSVYQR